MAYAIYSLYNIYRTLNKCRQGIPPLHPPPAGYFHATTQTFSQPRRFANVLADYVSVCVRMQTLAWRIPRPRRTHVTESKRTYDQFGRRSADLIVSNRKFSVNSMRVL